MKLNEIKTEIDTICARYRIENYTINDDGSIDVENDVNLSQLTFTELPLKFGRVTGNFYCYDCANLNSLEGAPTSVGGSFICYDCPKLTSLEGAPTSIGSAFYCSQCSKLTKLSHIKSAKSLHLKSTPITNLLYVFKIKGLEEIISGIEKLDGIINKHLKSDRDIMDCQEELIEAGFERYAKL